MIIGCHSVGNLGSRDRAFDRLVQSPASRCTFEIKPSNMFSIELFAYTALEEWGGAKLRVPSRTTPC